MQSVVWLDSAVSAVDDDNIIIHCRSGNHAPIVRMPRGAFRAYIEASSRMLNAHERAECDARKVVDIRSG